MINKPCVINQRTTLQSFSHNKVTLPLARNLTFHVTAADREQGYLAFMGLGPRQVTRDTALAIVTPNATGQKRYGNNVLTLITKQFACYSRYENRKRSKRSLTYYPTYVWSLANANILWQTNTN